MIGWRWLILAFAVGAAWLQTQPALPPLAWAAVLPLLALLLAAWRRQGGATGRIGKALQVAAALLLAAVLGFFYAAWRAETLLAETLPRQWEGRDVALSGRVLGLPETTPNGLRFVLDLARVDTAGAVLPGRIQLGWFARPGEPMPVLAGGDCLELTARLFRPRGGSNPGGFDYEAWLLERGIRATGSLLGQPRPGANCPGAARGWLDRTRTAVRAHLRAALPAQPYAGVVVALAVGDQDAIPVVRDNRNLSWRCP